MSDQPQKPSRMRRLVVLFLVFLVALLMSMVLLKDAGADHRNWGSLLSDIKDGHVLRVTIDQDEVEVVAKGNQGTGKEVSYQVDYPGGVISENSLKELHDSIRDYNDHRAGTNDLPIEEKGVPAKGVVAQMMPWLVLTGVVLVLYGAIFGRMLRTDATLSADQMAYHRARVFIRLFRGVAWILALILGQVAEANLVYGVVLGCFLGGLAHALMTGILAVLDIAGHTGRMRALMEQDRADKDRAAGKGGDGAAGAVAKGASDDQSARGP